MTAPADDVTVVWLAPADVLASREDAQRSLAEWGRARGVHLVSSQDAPARGSIHVDLAAADRAERELDRARDALAGLDGDAADRALARAEAILRDHPELPQAAWLRAEVDRAWSARFMRIEPRDEARAAAAWQDAEALDGGRVPGVGEVATKPRAKIASSVVVRGASARAVTVRVDGEPVPAKGEAHPFELPAGEHQVVAYADGEPVFAQWIAITAPTQIPVELGGGGACDAAGFSGVSRGDASDVRAPGVTCGRWIAVVPAERRGAVLVARCERDACGPLVEWRVEAGVGSPLPPPAPRGSSWPAWATWTLVGVGAVAAGTIAVVASGALESRPVEPRFVAGGVRTESLR